MAEKTCLANWPEYCDNRCLGHSGETEMTFGYGLLALIVAIAGYLVYAYNALVSNKNLLPEGWSGIH
ncbi:MAG TPA: hypothetical protein PKV23_10385, partial [Aestuariivirga sp.]|nr:hypothetical protein [Aestuariivirga sp.]